MVLRSDGGMKWYMIYKLLVWCTGIWHVKNAKGGLTCVRYVVVNKVAQCRGRNTCAANSASQERNIPCICGRCFRRQGEPYQTSSLL